MSSKLNYLIEKMTDKPYLLEMGKGKLARWFKCSTDDIIRVKAIVRSSSVRQDVVEDIIGDPIVGSRILVIGDTHIPYEHSEYLKFCKDQYDRFNCDTVVHIGDLLDIHATSHHPSMPDAYSPGDELAAAKEALKAWYKEFPSMYVCMGNHDFRISRLAVDSRISSAWLRSYAEVLEAPAGWKFSDDWTIGDIFFTHGTGTSGVTAAYRRALNMGTNVVIGHLHSEASILYHRLRNKTIWGMIVGCGVNENSYGMQYAINQPKKSVLGCGIIIEGQPLFISM